MTTVRKGALFSHFPGSGGKDVSDELMHPGSGPTVEIPPHDLPHRLRVVERFHLLHALGKEGRSVFRKISHQVVEYPLHERWIVRSRRHNAPIQVQYSPGPDGIVFFQILLDRA